MTYQRIDPVIIIWRKGTADDPFVPISETKQVINSMVVLSEIPDEINKVHIDGYYEITNGIPASNQFIVDYRNGIITFNKSEENKQLTISYMGRGYLMYPAQRIYLQGKDPALGHNLQTILNDIERGHVIFEEVATKVEEANLALDIANQASQIAMNASQIATEALSGVDEKLTAIDTATVNANQAANAANQAASDVNTAKTNAQLAANAANQAADAANAVIIEAQEAVTSANTAAQNATEKALTAQNAANLANEKANLANQAAQSANIAAQNANEKANLANQAAQNVHNAIDLANTAAQNANEKANLAETNAIIAGNTQYVGEWNSTTQYKKNNIVSYNGSSYIAINDNKNVSPPNSQYWGFIANKGDKGDKGDIGITWKGDYNSNVQYAIRDAVFFNGNSYICKSVPPVGTAPTNTTYWDILAMKGSDGTGTGTVTSVISSSTDIIVENPNNDVILTLNTGLGPYQIVKRDENGRIPGVTVDPATPTSDGLMTASDKAKLDGIANGATKVEKSNTNGNIKINGQETVVYTHPSNHDDRYYTKTQVDEKIIYTYDSNKNATFTGIVTANTFKNSSGKEVTYVGHTHTKSQITDMPTKLSEFENDLGFTNYEHPDTHPATMIIEDANHRFVTDAEKQTWNNKANLSGANFTGPISAPSITINGGKDWGNVATDPTNASEGDKCYNTTEKAFKVYDGTRWINLLKYL